MPMRYEPEQTLAAFEALVNPSGNITEVQNFLDEYFLPVGSDLVSWIPPDYSPEPPIVQDMSDSYYYKNFTRDINALWLVLGRNITDAVVEHPERHSFLPLAHPMVVPGGRFRESYYWDTWWIMRGLLVCDMNTTAYYVLDNLMHEVETFGFVPNGARIYYLDRSQPPVLSQMIVDYLTYNIFHFNLSNANTGNAPVLTPFLSDLVTRGISILETEYAWWMNVSYTQHAIPFTMSSDVLHPEDEPFLNPNRQATITVYLNRYHSNASSPRPESYTEDYYNSLFDIRSTEEVNTFYHNVRAGAESGWDFSSRWIAGLTNISYIATTDIIPVELNCFLYKLEFNIAYLLSLQASQLPDYAILERQALEKKAMNYTAQARLRYYGIQSFLFDNSSYHWRDYNLSSRSFAQRNVTFNQQGEEITSYSTVAYWLPLWAEIYPDMNVSIPTQVQSLFPPTNGSTPTPTNQTQSLTTLPICEQLVRSFTESGLLQVAGVLTTTAQESGQQWDAPNAWPPLVFLLIEGMQFLSKNAFSYSPTTTTTTTSASSIQYCLSAGYIAGNITENWLWTNYLAYNSTQFMYEKYNAYELGIGGGGGEYVPQIGFGWTNGVALLLINDTYRSNASNIRHHDDVLTDDTYIINNADDDDNNLPISVGAVVATVLLPLFFIGVAIFGVLYCYKKRDEMGGENGSMLGSPMLMASTAEIVSPIAATTATITDPRYPQGGNTVRVGEVDREGIEQTEARSQSVQLVDQRHVSMEVADTRASVATVTALPV
jgi:alpha,alpha-trehalase